jgi:hypothetical protein
MFLTTKYKMTVRINPEMTVPHSESSGFFIALLLECGIVQVATYNDRNFDTAARSRLC